MKRTALIMLVIALALCIAVVVGIMKKTENDEIIKEEGIENTDYMDYTFVDTTGMTDLQRAIVITAESFYLRGNRAQYDMSSLLSSGGLPERRLVKKKSPEDYTVQNVGYTDCSGFSYDVYWNALDMMITPLSDAWTKPYVENTEHLVLKHMPELEPEKFDTSEEIEKYSKEFLDTLQPGDLIVYRYAGNSGGHAMLYAGNGMMFHSSGDSYKRSEMTERYEDNGTYLYDSVSAELLNPESRRYLFNKYTYVILRPLDNFTGEIPQKTLARMDKMRGVAAEKLCSHTSGQTVNPGDSVVYTFSISNYTSEDKCLLVTDTVPQNAVWVSGGETVEGDKISWSITVPSGETVELSYTVQVKADAVIGDTLKSNGSVEGISVNCPPVYINKTLNYEEQRQFISECNSSELRGVELVSAIYKSVLGVSLFDGITAEDILNGVFKDAQEKLGDSYIGVKLLDKKGAFIDMLVPNMYGGHKVAETSPSGKASTNRTRMVVADKLVVGDIIVCNKSENEVCAEMYLFLGDSVLDVSNMNKLSCSFLDQMIGYRHFAVIRPSFALDN